MSKHLLGLLFFINTAFITTPVYAGDVMKKGEVLEEDSYVFTVEEATKLLKRVEELEAKEEVLNKYLEIDELRTQEIDLYKLNLDYTRNQLGYYIDLSQTNQDLIDRYNKRRRFDTIENIGFLFLGVALTTTSFVVADKITDGMESN